MLRRIGFPPKGWLAIPWLLVLLLAVACGAAATVAPPAATTAPAPSAGTSAAPTAAPKATAAPAAPVVNPGKLTIMMGSLANERFDVNFQLGLPAGLTYGRVVHGFLISDDEKKDLVPGIASQWGLSPDGLSWTFTIRKGVKFHDGTELTPQDVLWTLQHTFGPQVVDYAIAPSSLRLGRNADKIELSGPDKVTLSTKIPVTDFGVLVSESGTSWYHMMPKRATLHDVAEEAAYDKNPIGAGPMKLVKHVPAASMTYERFDDFYYQPKNGFPEDKRPNFRTLDIVIVPEEATRVAALRAGDADIAPASLSSKKQVEAGGGRLVFGEEGVFVWVPFAGCWETKHPCSKKGVRQALDYAINKELIRDRLYGGPQVFQVKGFGAVTPSTIGYSTAIDPWPFDPNKARQLLADAGYPGGKGFGKLVLNTYPSGSMPFQVEAAELAAENWKRELGLDVELRVVDSTAIRSAWAGGEINGQITWRDNETRKDATGTITTSYADPKNNIRQHEDPELFRISQEAVQTVDPIQRAEATRKLLLRLRDESYQLGIGYANIPWAVGPRVVTWRPYPLGVYPSALHTITLK
ncbi:MAG TPA: ABC transporter substrate-binding protein [Dehalococcoidia bacterium]|nr:ABC transporter substrate-binding protein [Dehalococcoidia bacterium]